MPHDLEPDDLEPDDLDTMLVHMEYPATTDDLVREAVRHGCPFEAVQALRALPKRSFQGVVEVRKALGRTSPLARANAVRDPAGNALREPAV